MPKVSVIIPARNEPYLNRTVDEVFSKAAGDVEAIVVLDGYKPETPPKERTNLRLIHFDRSHGMRPAINAAAGAAKGKYLMKLDAHCLLAEGYDEILAAECDDNWIVVPRRYSLDANRWAPIEDKRATDYHYLCYPHPNGALHGIRWDARARERENVEIDDEMSSQGSCWFMTQDHFWKRIGGMDAGNYGTFAQEFQELGLKTWLGGGRVAVNKRTWYAHWHKPRDHGRGYFLSAREKVKGEKYSTDYWMNNRWPDRQHDIEWLIEKFWPVPTWPEYFFYDPTGTGSHSPSISIGRL